MVAIDVKFKKPIYYIINDKFDYEIYQTPIAAYGEFMRPVEEEPFKEEPIKRKYVEFRKPPEARPEPKPPALTRGPRCGGCQECKRRSHAVLRLFVPQVLSHNGSPHPALHTRAMVWDTRGNRQPSSWHSAHL